MSLKILAFGTLILKGTLPAVNQFEKQNIFTYILSDMFLKWGHLSCLITTLYFACVAKHRLSSLSVSPQSSPHLLEQNRWNYYVKKWCLWIMIWRRNGLFLYVQIWHCILYINTCRPLSCVSSAMCMK